MGLLESASSIMSRKEGRRRDCSVLKIGDTGDLKSVVDGDSGDASADCVRIAKGGIIGESAGSCFMLGGRYELEARRG